MPNGTTRIRSRLGPAFDCYLAAPASKNPVPAVVLASSIRGVDGDLRDIADEFAVHGYIAAAPDLFWRTAPGPLERDDLRAAERAQPRLERIQAGEQDLADVLSMLRGMTTFNGAAVVMGFCYGGPYAVLGPKRLGYQAGIACHGSQMLDFLPELEGIQQPVSMAWGDEDHLAPTAVRDAFSAAAHRMQTVEVHVFRGVQHGFMFRGNPSAFDPEAYDFCVRRAVELLATVAGPACSPENGVKRTP